MIHDEKTHGDDRAHKRRLGNNDDKHVDVYYTRVAVLPLCCRIDSQYISKATYIELRSKPSANGEG